MNFCVCAYFVYFIVYGGSCKFVCEFMFVIYVVMDHMH